MVLEVGVGGDEDFETIRLCRGKEFAVLQLRPAALIRRLDHMPDKRMSERRRGALVEEDAHLGGRE